MSAEELRKAVEFSDFYGILSDAQWAVIKQALRDQEAEIARLREVASLIPSNWCDPMLTGSTAVIGILAPITAHLGAEQ